MTTPTTPGASLACSSWLPRPGWSRTASVPCACPRGPGSHSSGCTPSAPAIGCRPATHAARRTATPLRQPDVDRLRRREHRDVLQRGLVRCADPRTGPTTRPTSPRRRWPVACGRGPRSTHRGPTCSTATGSPRCSRRPSSTADHRPVVAPAARSTYVPGVLPRRGRLGARRRAGHGPERRRALPPAGGDGRPRRSAGLTVAAPGAAREPNLPFVARAGRARRS